MSIGHKPLTERTVASLELLVKVQHKLLTMRRTDNQARTAGKNRTEFLTMKRAVN